MSSLFPLEDFGAAPKPRAKAQKVQDVVPQPAPPVRPSEEEIEANRMAAYEQGYKAGWDDATRAEGEDQSRIGAEFARNLQDLGFTFHEARSHVMKALEPLLTEMVSKVLPNLVNETLGQTILEELLPMAENASDAPIQIVVSPASRPAIQRLIDDSLTIPLDIIEEPSLAEGQVYLRMGELEKKIDMDAAVDKIGKAINAVYALNEEAMKHG
ncbi:flagellar biosynthesis protein [uncultured Celeribacter sp.]|uniref:FliH/SctL family protein n=1 Tax=uncultured Celeribacter sp. TaxID=1303376 RepID=UPI002AA90AE4|nr:flagellar biosynthesis protein [uncultured Celeribacter sp.]